MKADRGRLDGDEYVAYLKPRWNELLSGTTSEPSVDEFVQRNPCLLPVGSGRVTTGRGWALCSRSPASKVGYCAFQTSCG